MALSNLDQIITQNLAHQAQILQNSNLMRLRLIDQDAARRKETQDRIRAEIQQAIAQREAVRNQRKREVEAAKKKSNTLIGGSIGTLISGGLLGAFAGAGAPTAAGVGSTVGGAVGPGTALGLAAAPGVSTAIGTGAVATATGAALGGTLGLGGGAIADFFGGGATGGFFEGLNLLSQPASLSFDDYILSLSLGGQLGSRIGSEF